MSEAKVVIGVDAGEAQQTVKSLKKEISDLKDRILNLTKGTDEYDEAVKQLQADQRKLDEVMALTKKTATALDGSYDALTQQMSLLKKEWRATADEARRAELGQQIDDLNNQLKEMDASVGNFQRNVGNYVSHWEGMPEVTKDFGDSMREMNENIEPTKAKFESVQKVASGLASGFAAVQGAAALLGLENENLEKTLVKVQAAMAIAQGIGGLGGLVEGVGKAKVAFQSLNSMIKVVNKTLGKSGWLLIITLLVTATASLVGWLKTKNTVLNDAREKVDSLAKANENLEITQNRVNKSLERDIKVWKAQGVAEEEILKKRKENYQNQIAEWQNKIREYEADYLSLSNKGLKDDELQPILDNIQEAKNNIIDLNEAIKDVENEEEILKITKEVEKEKELAEAIKRRNELVQEVIESANDIEVEDIDIDIDVNQNENTSKKGSVYNTIAAKELTLRRELNQTILLEEEEREQKEYELRQRFYETKKELLEQALEDTRLDAKERGKIMLELAELEIQIEKEKYEKIDEERQKDLEKEKEAKEKKKGLTNSIISTTVAGLSATKSILDKVAEGYETDGEITEKEAKKMKSIRYATTVIDMMQGIVSALASAAGGGPAGWIAGGIQAAAIAATGAMSLAEIRKQDFSTMNNAPTPTISTSAYNTDTPFSYTRQLTGAAEADALNQDTRVYILESDIQSSNKKVSIRESESTF